MSLSLPHVVTKGRPGASYTPWTAMRPPAALARPGYTASVLALAPVVRWLLFLADMGAFLTLLVANGALRAAKRAELQRAKLQRPNRRAVLEGVTFLGFFSSGWCRSSTPTLAPPTRY